jgi:hypothetical protein
VESKLGAREPFAAALAVLLGAGCGNGVPVPTNVSEPLATISPPDEAASQFAVAVQRFARDTEIERATPSDQASYAGLQSALEELADALVLLPRGADVLVTRNAAGAIRRDAERVGAGVLDNTGRTKALRHALGVASQTLEAVARGAYPNVVELSPLVSNLNEAIASIDDSQLLYTQKPAVSGSFDQALSILRTMQAASS